MPIPRLLSIAGTDPSGGAGMHADLKTFSALGGYGTSAITAVVSQNTCGVRSVYPLPLEVLESQLKAIFDDVAIDAVKIGMVADRATAELIKHQIETYAPKWVVLDPVMVAKSGDRLVDDAAVDAVRTLLMPLADVATPNLPEAAELLGIDTPQSESAMLDMASALRDLGARQVLLKGGFLEGPECNDLLIGAEHTRWLEAPRIETRHLHGTGCTLSSAIATLLPQRDSMEDAILDAKSYMTGALEQADRLGVGHGQGPVHHFHRWW
ncbi:bifunctional hydroxymethylpyrimidine kinase/phosphomethylpyrimidine kinase [Larsenimonas suaedae]|uniref:hydroxymethylpyrimidine kinase n=1 Tax=Larsenimonas suaedae TaxID=1851019 RepID=A0ABU1GYE1_9GAMM|nr:bifunctional hydroxymethylpyrimidine kinase/phosphomethylpyrimidine kinase [Larsenimonas suaedae]MDR5897065.1 bifunctional hydroxymethylpyrimidine kinase/phosphomethylpyrimidine kinase [Larsenimonas suaedae]